MRIFGNALAIALSVVILAIILAAVGVYLVWLAVSLLVGFLCWFLADVVFKGNRKYGMRFLDPIFDWIEDTIIHRVSGVAIIPIVLAVELWRAFAKNGYRITWRGRGQGPNGEPPGSPAVVDTPIGPKPSSFAGQAQPIIAH